MNLDRQGCVGLVSLQTGRHDPGTEAVMTFPERFSHLPEYAFPRLRRLLDAYAPGGDVIQMTIGEPRHAFPAWIMDEIAANAEGFGKYPPNEGTPELLHRTKERPSFSRRSPPGSGAAMALASTRRPR